jgi:phosphoribosylanthranilate isomerase
MRPIHVKICGVTRPDDAAWAVAAGAGFLGLNFWPSSKRYLPVEQAPAVADAARAAGPIELVGVFVNAALEVIARATAAAGLDVIQLHGDETPQDVAAIQRATERQVWKAIALGGPEALAELDRWPADALLLDAPAAGRGGGGVVFDWSLARQARHRYPDRRFVLAGGLAPHNVADAIAAADPWVVDVASGVESAPGIKDRSKLTAFVAAVTAFGR